MKTQKKVGVAGLLGGLANGLFGGGAGLFLVPLYTRWAGMEDRRAFATSVGAVLALSLVSAAMYLLEGELPLGQALPYGVGGFLGLEEGRQGLGGVLAGRLLGKASPLLLRRAFGGLLLAGGVKALFFP